MTAAFEYEEPATIPMTAANAAEASSLADDQAAAALSMINNGPASPTPAAPLPVPTATALDDNQEEVASDSGATISQEEGTADEEVEPSEDEPAVYSDEEYAELCRQADERYAAELQSLETEYAQAGVDRSKIQDELKDAKGTEKLLLESIRKLQSDGPNYPSKVKPKPPRAANQEDGSSDNSTFLADDQAAGSLSPQSDVPYADPNNLVATTPEHEAYYNTPTASLLAGIDGLGKAKMERLIEVAPTCRDLQSLNIQAGRYHHGDISELLPSGFGKALGERIIERLLDKMPFVKPS